MSKQSGLFVFTATPEMAQALPKVFRPGMTYIAQRADSVIAAARPSTTGRKAGGSTTGKKVTKASTTGKKVSKTSSPKPSVNKAPKGARGKKAVSPEVVVQFVRDNEGCNMTQIEAATKMAQPAIRKALNDAREAGLIRTEGQRRGLRYFATTAVASSPTTSDKPENSGAADSGKNPW